MAQKKVSRTKGKTQLRYQDGNVVGYGADDLSVRVIPAWLARAIIRDKHYSHKVVNNSYINLGVFFYNELVGVIQLGYALQPASGSNVVFGTGNREYAEINRMWVHDCMPKNTESRVISYSIKYIKRIYPSIQWIQTFADERCGRNGVVYQACSFDYIGCTNTAFYELDGEVFHQVSIRKGGGVKSRYFNENKHRAIKKKFKQHRYIKFLDKRAKRRLNPKFVIQVYPK